MDQNDSLDPLTQRRRIIGRNIAARRTYLGMSQESVARELRVSRRRFSTWENGDRPVPAEYLEPMSRLFGVRLESIYREPQ